MPCLNGRSRGSQIEGPPGQPSQVVHRGAVRQFGHPAECSKTVKSKLKSSDISVELTAEQSHEVLNSLARERNALRTMIDLMPTCVYAKDIHSRFIAANAGVAKCMGTTPEGLVGKTDFDFYPPAMAEKFIMTKVNARRANRSRAWNIAPAMARP